MTRDGGFAAQESNDGIWLYFTKARTAGLWRQPTRGGVAEKILDDLEPTSWGNWQLVDEAVIFARADGADTSIVHMHLETGIERVVTMLPGPVLNPGLAVSPDGHTVWFTRLENSESDLRWVVGATVDTSR